MCKLQLRSSCFGTVGHSRCRPVDVGGGPNHTPARAFGRLGRHGLKNAAMISPLRGEARRGLQANHQRITNRAYVTKNRLVFRQTSKGTVEALAREGPRQGKDVAGLP
jgi:hypothetical protein